MFLLSEERRWTNLILFIQKKKNYHFPSSQGSRIHFETTITNNYKNLYKNFPSPKIWSYKSHKWHILISILLHRLRRKIKSIILAPQVLYFSISNNILVCKHHKHEKESNFKNNLDSRSLNANLFLYPLIHPSLLLPFLCYNPTTLLTNSTKFSSQKHQEQHSSLFS